MEIAIPNAEIVDVSQLTVDQKNPNKMSKEQHERLATSIKKWGFIVPIITNKDLLIADGEQRWTVAKSLGMSQVSVIRLPVEEVDRRLLRQVLNKLRGEHELLLDAEEFDKIIDLGRKDDLKYLLDLTDGKLERYLNELHPPKDEDFEVPEIEKVQTDIVKGDIIQLGKHRLMCGDSTNNEQVKQVCPEKVNLVFTDPPYNVGKDFANDDLTGSEFDGFNDSWIRNIPAGDNCAFICYHSTRTFPSVLTKALNNKWHLERTFWFYRPDKFPINSWHNWVLTSQIIMLFSHSNIAFKDKSPADHDCYVCKANDLADKTIHPTQKIMGQTVDLMSHFNSDKVLDLFGGSGSTLIACEQTGRVCYMMEIDPRYCEIIAQRWEKYTGQKRKLVKSCENNV